MKKYIREKKLTNSAQKRIDAYLGFVYGARHGANIHVRERMPAKHVDVDLISAIMDDWSFNLYLVPPMSQSNDESVSKPLSTALLKVGALSIIPDWTSATMQYCQIFHNNKTCLAACLALNSIIRHIMRGPRPINQKTLKECTQSCRFIVPPYMHDDWDRHTNLLCRDLKYLQITKKNGDNVLKTLGCVIWAVRQYIKNPNVDLQYLFDDIVLQNGGLRHFIIVGGMIGCLRGFNGSDFKEPNDLNAAVVILFS